MTTHSAVPGPPRARRRLIPGTTLERVQAMRRAEQELGGFKALLRFAWDVILLVKDLAADPAISAADKAVAVAAVAYLVSPVDLVPDWIPVLGALDDLLVAGYGLKRLLDAAGYERIYRHWRGSEEGLTLLLALAGPEERQTRTI